MFILFLSQLQDNEFVIPPFSLVDTHIYENDLIRPLLLATKFTELYSY